jgi:hypothetical protein
MDWLAKLRISGRVPQGVRIGPQSTVALALRQVNVSEFDVYEEG